MVRQYGFPSCQGSAPSSAPATTGFVPPTGHRQVGLLKGVAAKPPLSNSPSSGMLNSIYSSSVLTVDGGQKCAYKFWWTQTEAQCHQVFQQLRFLVGARPHLVFASVKVFACDVQVEGCCQPRLPMHQISPCQAAVMLAVATAPPPLPTCHLGAPSCRLPSPHLHTPYPRWQDRYMSIHTCLFIQNINHGNLSIRIKQCHTLTAVMHI